ncbi:ubiquitin carboxyl-terminal hydrolase [Anaeramoeba flamelloides]|uniref:Ubiquitin carboxyl-terminal hydrolase n=1 Tax=Anaeramoeba flamelloides TaxID=1746091 RepID=A0AAV8A7I0_9EUKA|nr:ubiquitin carboxyl-terminal hydrolase [Anaeramoeba flamelloides]
MSNTGEEKEQNNEENNQIPHGIMQIEIEKGTANQSTYKENGNNSPNYEANQTGNLYMKMAFDDFLQKKNKKENKIKNKNANEQKEKAEIEVKNFFTNYIRDFRKRERNRGDHFYKEETGESSDEKFFRDHENRWIRSIKNLPRYDNLKYHNYHDLQWRKHRKRNNYKRQPILESNYYDDNHHKRHHDDHNNHNHHNYQNNYQDYRDNFDSVLNKAIEQSMLEHKLQQEGKKNYECTYPNTRRRIKGTHTGLKNIGNTCYVNSLLQSYFHIKDFRDELLKFKPTEKMWNQLKNQLITSSNLNEIVEPITTIHELQRLFSQMLLSQQKFVDPSALLNSMKVQTENEFTFNQQQDITEFNHLLWDKIESGMIAINQLRIYIENENNKNNETNIKKQSGQAKKTNNNKNDDHHNDKDKIGNEKRNGNEIKTVNKKEQESKNGLQTQIENNQNKNLQEQNQENEKMEIEFTLDLENIENENGNKNKNENNGNLKKLYYNKNELISKLFHGEILQILRTKGKMGRQITRKTYNNFGEIILNSEFGNLYSAMDNYIFDENIKIEIEEKKFSTGTIQRAFSKFPPILFLLIQRIHYDKNLKKGKKLNRPFLFEKEIYLDRYLEKNSEKAMILNNESKILKEKLKKAEKKLLRMNEFQNEKIPLLNILETTLKYVKEKYQNILKKEQNIKVKERAKEKETEKEIEIENVNINGKENMGIANDNDNIDVDDEKLKIKYEKSIKVLNDQIEIVKEKTKKLNSEIKLFKKQLFELYKDMKNIKYYLHSVLVHRGNVNSGHYFCYIYDKNNDKWNKYNDREVTPIEEKKVFLDSYGEHNNTESAYCLVYTSEDHLKSEKKNKKPSINLIPKELNEETTKQNNAFLKKLEDWNCKRTQQKRE